MRERNIFCRELPYNVDDYSEPATERVFCCPEDAVIVWHLDFKAMQEKAAKFRRHENNRSHCDMMARDTVRREQRQASILAAVADITDADIARMLADVDEDELARMMNGELSDAR